MDNYRLILSMTLLFLGALIWQAWNAKDNDGNGLNVNMNQNLHSSLVDVASTEIINDSDLKPNDIGNKDIKISISPKGTTIIGAYLLNYKDSNGNIPFKLLNKSYIYQTGLLSNTYKLPDHNSIFVPLLSENSQDNMNIKYKWSDEGLDVIRTFSINENSYLVDVTTEIINNTNQELHFIPYSQIQRKKPDIDSKTMVSTYTGSSYFSSDSKFVKVPFDKIGSDQNNVQANNSWLAMMEQYFISAIIPENKHVTIFNKKNGDNYIIGYFSNDETVEVGKSIILKERAWIGPTLQNEISKVANGLEFTTDYGLLSFIAKPLFWSLDYINSVINNWGWSIIILTIIIKGLFYKLSESSYKSMAELKKLSPKLQTIKEQYGEDKEKLNKAMMELYQKEKINPLGGCLPLLVQIPVFIALYWVLLESVELKDAPFILWITTLSEKDPYFILPIIMGITMIIQQKLNPAPPDPIQAKVMMSLPFIFTAMFAFFPAGLVLYWVVNNILSIAQQWNIARQNS